LLENIACVRQYGDNEMYRTERAKIVDVLNQLALETVGVSFNELCDLSIFTLSESLRSPAESAIATLLTIPDAGIFLDRELTLEEIVQKLKRHRLVIVQGLAGVGKTSVVAKLAREIESQYDNVVWIKCREKTNFDYILLMIGAFLAEVGETQLLDTALSGAKLCSAGECAAILLRQLQTLKLLVVFDDFDNAMNRYRYIEDSRLQRVFEILLEKAYDSSILITSRFSPKLPRRHFANYAMVEVNGLEKQESLKLLQDVGNVEAQDEILSRVHDAVRGHPFALKIFASLTAFYPPEILLAERNLFLSECGENLLNKLFKSLRAKEVEWVKRLSVLRGPFALETLMGLGGALPMIELLRTRFLLDFDSRLAVYHLHPLIRDFAYARTSNKKRKEYHAIAARYYSSRFTTDQINIHNFSHAIEASYHYSRAGDLRHTIEIQIGFTESLHYLGLLFFRRRDYQQAERCYSAILQLDDHDDKAHFYYAASIDLQGPARRAREVDTIEKHYLQALEVRPRSTQYLDYYAYFLMNIRRHNEARDFFERGVQLSARCPTLYKRYGSLLKELGEFQRAEEVLARGCKIAYKSGQVFLEYAQLRVTQGQIETARDILRKGLKRNPNYKPLARALEALGDEN